MSLMTCRWTSICCFGGLPCRSNSCSRPAAHWRAANAPPFFRLVSLWEVAISAMAATKACESGWHGGHRRGDNGGSGRSGTSAPWRTHSAAIQTRPGHCQGGRHHRTNHADCAGSYKADAPRLTAAEAQDLVWTMVAPTSRPADMLAKQSGAASVSGGGLRIARSPSN
jgi:hypothetical protein